MKYRKIWAIESYRLYGLRIALDRQDGSKTGLLKAKVQTHRTREQRDDGDFLRHQRFSSILREANRLLRRGTFQYGLLHRGHTRGSCEGDARGTHLCSHRSQRKPGRLTVAKAR